MKHPLRFGLFLLALISSATASRATHMMGGQITYSSLGGNRYRVRVEEHYDAASAASQNRNLTLVCKSNGCTNASAGSFLVPLTATASNMPAPYCNGGQLLLLVAEADVTLPVGQWTLSLDEENRSSSARNLVSPDQRSMHLATLLDNTTRQANSSPQFTETALPIATAGQPHRYSFAAFDADGDSLAYSLVPAMWSPVNSSAQQYPCPLAMPYQAYNAGTATDAATGQSVPYPAGQFSASFPFPSYRIVNGAAMPWVELNAQTGQFQAHPQPLLGDYALAVRVDEYRRLNGRATLLGSVTREVTYRILANANLNPSLTVSQGGVVLPLNQVLDVLPGQTVALTFTGADPNANQTLRLSSNVTDLLPGATFQANTTAPTAQFSWQVPAAAAGAYAFSVRVADNACPLNGTDTRSIVVRINRQRPTATRPNKIKAQLTAYPTPFATQVSFQLSTPRVQPVEVTDGLGRVVAQLRSAADGLVTWTPSALPAGVYVARTLDATEAVRLVKTQ